MQERNLSDEIRNCRDGVVHNPYQGKDKKVLFVCSMGILRSATAARMYAHKYNTRSAGSYYDALIPINGRLIEWADEIVFVNRENYEHVHKELTGNSLERFVKKVKVLDIPDRYEHMDPRLQAEIKAQYENV